MRIFLTGVSACSLIILLACQSGMATKPLDYTFVLADSNVTALCNAALKQTNKKVTYNGSYYSMKYPGGDVPDSIGVCTDVLIRAYRVLGYDLQKLIHEDMIRATAAYKARRNFDRIDANIDHRRTPHMETFFARKGKKLIVSDSAADYKPGDIVFWDVAAGHVGIVVNVRCPSDTSRCMIVHNIGAGPKLVDFLFGAKILGHYRYSPWQKR